VTAPHVGFCCVLLGGDDYRLKVGGLIYHFEMHPWCGPVVLNKRGDPSSVQPAARTGFWEAVTCWAQQGQHVGEDGLCIWWLDDAPHTGDELSE
jgi:hypothetical protein